MSRWVSADRWHSDPGSVDIWQRRSSSRCGSAAQRVGEACEAVRAGWSSPGPGPCAPARPSCLAQPCPAWPTHACPSPLPAPRFQGSLPPLDPPLPSTRPMPPNPAQPNTALPPPCPRPAQPAQPARPSPTPPCLTPPCPAPPCPAQPSPAQPRPALPSCPHLQHGHRRLQRPQHVLPQVVGLVKGVVAQVWEGRGVREEGREFLCVVRCVRVHALAHARAAHACVLALVCGWGV